MRVGIFKYTFMTPILLHDRNVDKCTSMTPILLHVPSAYRNLIFSTMLIQCNKTSSELINVTLKRVRATSVAVEL